jgi:hypothetical protein
MEDTELEATSYGRSLAPPLLQPRVEHHLVAATFVVVELTYAGLILTFFRSVGMGWLVEKAEELVLGASNGQTVAATYLYDAFW